MDKKWFTLIEMIVAVTVIWIILASVTTINFSRLSERQKQEIFINTIIWNIETIRNYAFQGKGIWTQLDIPNEWKIEISSASSWTLLTTYSWAVSWTYKKSSFKVKKWNWIKKIICKKTDWSENDISSGTWTIIFKWDNASLSWWCTDPSEKILQLTLQRWAFEDIVEINTISNIIQKK